MGVPLPRWRLANNGSARRVPMCSRSSCDNSRRIGTSRRLAPLPRRIVTTRSEAHILDSQLHQLGGTHAGLEQRLQHQAGAAVLCVGMIEKTPEPR